MSPQDFHDHAKWQNYYYRVPAVGEFKQSHMFTINVTDQGVLPTILRKQDDITAPICIDNMIPTSRNRQAK